MSGYIVSEKQTFEIFLRTERVLVRNKYPVVSNFTKNEATSILKELNLRHWKNEKIIEIGCGSGRLLKVFKNNNFDYCGFDNDKLFVDYCKERGLNVFYGDATKKLGAEHKNRYGAVVIAFNTLFNFNRNKRKEWIKNANYLLKKDGLLIFTVYANNKTAKKDMQQRVDFYRDVIKPEEICTIHFSTKKSRIEVIYKNETVWFSEWKKKNEIIKEIKGWKGFKFKSVKLIDGGIAYLVRLSKL